jgi:hypothetical protein
MFGPTLIHVLRFELVWAEATKLYQEMIQTQGWVSEKDIMISATNEFTSKVH